LLVNKILYKFN